MKILCVIAFLFFPVISFAAIYGGAEGYNQLGERIYIASETYYELYIIKGPGNTNSSKPYDMNVECPEFKNAMEKSEMGQTFSCPPQRNFPLSGTTYRITTSKKYRPCDVAPIFEKSLGTIYVCIKGCDNKRAPKVFKEMPGSCA